jgi:hypothetical protein
MHQAASSVIYKYKQAAFRRTTFKPVMMGAVYLDKLSETITTMSGLINP